MTELERGGAWSTSVIVIAIYLSLYFRIRITTLAFVYSDQVKRNVPDTRT